MSKTARAGRDNRRRQQGVKAPQPIAIALQQLTHNLGITKTLRQYDVIASWKSIVGHRIARVTEAQRMDNGILFVTVATAPWRAELSMMRPEIIKKINSSLGTTIVKDIRFR
jgi:predicted nucleic acid-binding Zn ribbon protein